MSVGEKQKKEKEKKEQCCVSQSCIGSDHWRIKALPDTSFPHRRGKLTRAREPETSGRRGGERCERGQRGRQSEGRGGDEAGRPGGRRLLRIVGMD